MYQWDQRFHEQGEEALASAILTVGTADFVPAVLNYLRTVSLFKGCFLSLLDGNRPPVHVYDNVRIERRSAVIDRYLDGAYLLDPLFVAYQSKPEEPVLRVRDVAPDRFQQSTYFQEYYQSIRLRDEAGLFVTLPSGKTLFYSIGRLRDEPRFSARDVAALRKAYPIFAALNHRHFGARVDVPEPPARNVDQIAAAFDRFGAGTLTDREREIACLILKGHSSKSVARTIDISPGTVKIHRKNMYRKLEISSQSELFALFVATLQRST